MAGIRIFFLFLCFVFCFTATDQAQSQTDEYNDNHSTNNNEVAGNFKNDINDQINTSKKFTGRYKNEQPHGYGTWSFENSNNKIEKLTGNFIEGKLQSPGHIVYNNGDLYDGAVFFKGFANSNFLIINREGHGKQRYANGEYYYGYWKNDKWDSTGTWIKKNDDRYVGEFFEGQLYGRVVARVNDKLSMHMYEKGTIRLDYQKQMDACYKEFRPHEKTDILLQQYALAEFMFGKECMFGDCENGIGISKYGVLNFVHYGTYKDGKPNGSGQMFCAGNDKTTYVGPFKDGKLHGMIHRHSEKGSNLDRIFYEGKMENGFYNSMEEFETILAKEIEEINKRMANSPSASIEYIYPKDNGNSTSSKKSKKLPFRFVEDFYKAAFLVTVGGYEPFRITEQVWVSIQDNGRVKLSACHADEIIEYQCDIYGKNGGGTWDDYSRKGRLQLISCIRIDIE